MLTKDIIRDYLQDDPRYNLLLDNKQQFTDSFIERVIKLTYQEAGSICPAYAMNTSVFPEVIILHGVISNLMRSENFKELRNQLQYNDNNLSSVSVFHKQVNYLELSALLKSEFKELLGTFAKASFMQGAWGQTSSNSTDYETLYTFSGNQFFGMNI